MIETFRIDFSGAFSSTTTTATAQQQQQQQRQNKTKLITSFEKSFAAKKRFQIYFLFTKAAAALSISKKHKKLILPILKETDST